MNSSKVKEEKREEKREEREREEIQIKPILSRVSLDQPELTADKNQEAEKKRREFFSATIFDEDDAVEGERKIDDDILNVPAFFRRKK